MYAVCPGIPQSYPWGYNKICFTSVSFPLDCYGQTVAAEIQSRALEGGWWVGGSYRRASSFALPQEYVNNALIWGLITAPRWPLRTFPPTGPVWVISSSLVPFRRWGAPRCLFTCLMAFNIVFTKLALEEGSADRAMQGGLTGRMHIH